MSIPAARAASRARKVTRTESEVVPMRVPSRSLAMSLIMQICLQWWGCIGLSWSGQGWLVGGAGETVPACRYAAGSASDGQDARPRPWPQVKIHDGGLVFSSMSSFSTSAAVTQKMSVRA